jgi:hypothetical protein
MIKSFSGCHPYNPHCIEVILNEDDVEITEVMDDINGYIQLGVCPRCRVSTLGTP